MWNIEKSAYFTHFRSWAEEAQPLTILAALKMLLVASFHTQVASHNKYLSSRKEKMMTTSGFRPSDLHKFDGWMIFGTLIVFSTQLSREFISACLCNLSLDIPHTSTWNPDWSTYAHRTCCKGCGQGGGVAARYQISQIHDRAKFSNSKRERCRILQTLNLRFMSSHDNGGWLFHHFIQ